jgi:hypothetical protein
MRPVSDSSWSYRKFCRSCGECFCPAPPLNYDCGWPAAKGAAPRRLASLDHSEEYAISDESEGDHGYGSYYTHAMTAADQGYW